MKSLEFKSNKQTPPNSTLESEHVFWNVSKKKPMHLNWDKGNTLFLWLNKFKP
jgi:hypothetical protein